MTRILTLLLGGLLLAPAAVRADDVRGWQYLVDRLAADGVDRERAAAAFRDPRMPAFTGLDFGLEPREPRSLYRRFLGAPSIAAARRCREENAAAFETAQRTHGVSASVVAAILYVETGCGRNTGSSNVLHALARLAMANEPANLEANVDRLAGRHDPAPALVARVKTRAQYLEDTFYPEVRAAFTLADRLHIDPLDLRGSGSGAFGYAQFLPTSYLRYGTDADGDGVVDMYDVNDAAASCANYLAANGWQAPMSAAAQRRVVWRYNHSDAYIDTVLSLSRWIDDESRPLPRTQVATKRVKGRATRTVTRKAPPARKVARRQATLS